MFDIGFSELLLIAVVALIVIGPERLPKVARTTGHLLGRLQRYVSDVKSDIQREMHLEEMRKLQTQVEESAREVERSVSKEVHGVEDALNRAAAGPADTSGPSAGAALATPDAAPAEPTPQMELTLGPAPEATTAEARPADRQP